MKNLFPFNQLPVMASFIRLLTAVPAFFPLALFHCLSEKPAAPACVFPQKLHIDITETDSCNLERFRSIDSMKAAVSRFEREFSEKNDAVDYTKHFRVIFRYRDRRLLPLLTSICSDTAVPMMHRAVAISVIGIIGDSTCQRTLMPYAGNPNPVFAECAVNALGKCGGKSAIDQLALMRKNETNGYYAATITAAIKRLCGNVPQPLNASQLLDTSGFVKTAFLSNPMMLGNSQTERNKRLDRIVAQTENHGEVIFPHQQYKMNNRTIFNVRTYGLQLEEGDYFHVGEDSGFLLEGLPVHAMADGTVTLILYEQSWGCLVAVESRLKHFGTVTWFYAHLSRFIDVEVGQKVSTGDKIGDIGSQESAENGGYYAHLHWGAAKGPFASELIRGYAPDTLYWYDPVTLVIRENHPNGVDYRKLIFKR